MKTFGYYHGRFQPFHNGHLSSVQKSLELCERLIIGISNPFRTSAHIEDSAPTQVVESFLEARDISNNPWPYWQRTLMILDSLISIGCDLRRIIVVPNLSRTGIDVDEARFPKNETLVIIHKKQAHNQYIYEQYKNDGWDVLDLGKSIEYVSGSVIRKYIFSGRDEWRNMVPLGTSGVIDKYPLPIQNSILSK
jgi:cytidyltransferase-like protein